MDIKDFKFATVLTGGIATGKSTVSKMLEDLGYKIIDADKIAHFILDLRKDDIANLFGKEYIKDDRVDRKRLGKLIFSDRDQRIRLESLLHPLIREQMLKDAKALESLKRVYFLDIPLYFESGEIDSSQVALVYAPRSLQIERLRRRDGLSNEEIEDRLNAQLPIEQKVSLSDFVIDNSGSLEDLKDNVNNFLKDLNESIKI